VPGLRPLTFAASWFALALLGSPHASAVGDQGVVLTTGVPSLSPAVSDLARTLRQSRSQPDVPMEVYVQQLDSLGAGDLPAFLELLERERVPALEPEQREQTLSEPQREILLAALARREPRAVQSALDRRLELANDYAGRLLALRVLGSVGNALAFERMVGLALVSGEETPPAGLEQALRESVSRILLRDSKAFAELPRLMRGSPGPLRAALVQAAGDTKQARAIEVFSSALVLQAELAPVVAAQVPRIGRSLDNKANMELVDRLRGLLESTNPNIQRAVVLALGELRDDRSIPALIDLLDSEDGGLAQNACWALQHATGLEFPAVSERWRRWYADERSWFAREERGVLRDLDSRDPAKVSTALREISRRRTERDALATEVVAVLQRAEPSLRAQACETLAALGSSVALPALLERLETDIPFCSQSAWRALRTITGLDLPSEAPAWRTALDTEA
jgi:HEAT repeat protein